MDVNRTLVNWTYEGDIISDSRFDPPLWIVAVKIMKYVCIPVIVIVGFCGNTLSILVFMTKSMRRSSCSVFLAALAFVDNLFLLTLLISSIDNEVQTIIQTDIACQALVFTTYLTSFLSAWFIVGFTCERFIAICFPLKSSYICSVFREKIYVFVLTVFAIFTYNFSFWTTESQSISGQPGCAHKIRYLNFLYAVTWVDTFLTMVLPFMIIVFANCMVLRAVANCPLRTRFERKQCRCKKYDILNCTAMKTGCDEHTRMVRPIQGKKHRTKRLNPQVRVTRTLLFVSTTFLFLNLPAHCMRLYNLISSLTMEVHTISGQFYFLQELTAVLYYTTFSCNFVLYTVFGRNFKKSLYLILRCKCNARRTDSRRSLRRKSSREPSGQATGLTSL